MCTLSELTFKETFLNNWVIDYELAGFKKKGNFPDFTILVFATVTI